MRPLREPMLLSVTGPDRPDILAALSGALDTAGIDIVDLVLASRSGELSLSFVLDLEEDDVRLQALRETVIPGAVELGLAARMLRSPVPRPPETPWKPTGHLVLTLISDRPSSRTVSVMAAAACRHQAGIVFTRRLAREDLRAAEYGLDVSRVSDVVALRRDLLTTAEQLGIDAGLAPDDVHRRQRKLAIFDMDSTLVQGEIIDTLAAAYGVGEEVAAVTSAAMEGKEDFETALRHRVRLLAGFPEDRLRAAGDRIRPTPGVEETLGVLKRLGYRLGVLSGGFTFFVEPFRARYGLDHAFANTLEIRDGKLTGELVGEIVDARAKARLLLEIANREGVAPAQVVAVGDGANDIPMLQAAGLGIAFHAREATRRAADACILGNDLRNLLYLLGVGDADREPIQGS